jgi:hypothetical protein
MLAALLYPDAATASHPPVAGSSRQAGDPEKVKVGDTIMGKVIALGEGPVKAVERVDAAWDLVVK